MVPQNAKPTTSISEKTCNDVAGFYRSLKWTHGRSPTIKPEVSCMAGPGWHFQPWDSLGYLHLAPLWSSGWDWQSADSGSQSQHYTCSLGIWLSLVSSGGAQDCDPGCLLQWQVVVLLFGSDFPHSKIACPAMHVWQGRRGYCWDQGTDVNVPLNKCVPMDQIDSRCIRSGYCG